MKALCIKGLIMDLVCLKTIMYKIGGEDEHEFDTVINYVLQF